MPTSNTILLRGGGLRPQEPVANEAITPGHLIERVKTGTHAGRVVKHASAGGPTAKMFAMEADYIGERVSDAYASGDRVHAIYPERGAKIYAWLASGQNVVLGQELVSNGDGTLRAWAAATHLKPNSIVAVAAEAVDASGATARIEVEVI